MDPCNLDRCHEKHVKLHVVIDKALYENDPLPRLYIQVFKLVKALQEQKCDMKSETD